MAFKRDGEDEKIGGSAGSAVLFAGNLCLAADRGADFRCSFASACRVTASDDHALAGAGRAQGQSEALRTGAAEDSDDAGDD